MFRPEESPLHARLVEVGAPLAAGCPAGTVLVWELRGSIRGFGGVSPRRVQLDGGVRVENGGESPAAVQSGANADRWARFVVAAAPGMGSSLLGLPASIAGPDWDECTAEFQRILSEAHAAATGRAAGRSHPAEPEISLRVRLIVRPAARFDVAWDAGCRWRSDLGAASDGTPGATLRVALTGIDEEPPPFDDLSGVEAGDPQGVEIAETAGCVLLGSQAAAWAAHELAHALIEGCVAVPDRLAVRVLDEPGSAPWPVGFAIDDVGQAASRTDLTAGDPPHLRRPSIRDWALPALSSTRLEVKSGKQISAASLPHGLFRIDRVRAGRFDAATRTMLLEASEFYRLDTSGTATRAAGNWLIVIEEEGWRGVSEVVGLPAQPPEPALCTRVGALNAVMVGAPTITLEPARLIPLKSRWRGLIQGLSRIEHGHEQGT